MSSNGTTDVTLFVSELTGGGAERMMLNLAGGFVDRGFATDLLVCRDGGGMRDQVPPDVRVVDFRAGRPMTSLPELILYLRRRRPEALLGALTNVSVLTLLARILSGTGTRVVTRTGNTISRQKVFESSLGIGLRFAHWLAPIVFPLADARVAVSQGVADDMAPELGLPRDSISTIYNPIVTERVLRRAEEGPDHPWLAERERPVVLAVGRLEVQKDYPTLFRAFARVRETVPARLLVLGEGRERSALESLVSRLGLADDVDMPGFVENPYAFMARARAFVLSSRWEGAANVLVEALACGAPVVATDCPSGPAELLGGGRCGRLVPVGDAEAMAEAILRTLSNPLDPAGPEWLERFSVDAGVEAYLEALGFAHDRDGDA